MTALSCVFFPVSAQQTDVYRYSLIESGFNSPTEVAIGYDFKKDGIMYRHIPEEGCVTVCAIDSTMKGVIVLPQTVTADDGKQYNVTSGGFYQSEISNAASALGIGFSSEWTRNGDYTSYSLLSALGVNDSSATVSFGKKVIASTG